MASFSADVLMLRGRMKMLRAGTHDALWCKFGLDHDDLLMAGADTHGQQVSNVYM